LAETPESPTPSPKGSLALGDGRARWTAVAALAILVGLAIWLIVATVGDDDSTPSPTAASSEPVAVSATGLATLEQAVGGPVYWVGPRGVSKYEVSQQNGQIYVRYLPDGVEVGDPQGLLTVATYAVADAYDVTAGTGREGADTVSIPGGGVAAISAARPTSAYVAFPGVDYQIEIYDPDPAVVRRLATGGDVKPVPAPEATVEPLGPEETSEDDLTKLSEELGHPIYWAGPRENATYELTMTADGRIFVRYLPPAAEVGASSAALTVATYPVADAYSITKRGASGEDSAVAEIPGGGIATYDKGKTTNVYLAYPGEDVQVEVFSPVRGVAPKLVSQGKIVPVD
jgi:hypothetical protein